MPSFPSNAQLGGDPPSGDAPKDAPADSSGFPFPLLAGKRALIAEDEGITHLQLRRCLIRAGLDVVGGVNNGRAAVEMARDKLPDIVLMDIRMPEMNGLDATRRISAEHSSCIIILTAYSDPDTVKLARSYGASAIINKPISHDELLAALAAAFERFLRDGSR